MNSRNTNDIFLKKKSSGSSIIDRTLAAIDKVRVAPVSLGAFAKIAGATWGFQAFTKLTLAGIVRHLFSSRTT